MLIQRFLFVCLITPASLPWLNAVRAEEKKFAGAQFARKAEAATRAEAGQKPTTSACQLPPLRVKVLIPEGKSVPEKLTRYLLPVQPPDQTWTATSGPVQAVLRNTTGDAIDAALTSDEVARIEVVRPPSLDPVDLVPFNIDARLSHFLPAFESTFHNGRGAAVKAAVFDGGTIRRTHVEFATGRVSVADGNAQADRHATHVAGTMAAKGVRAEAIGMAPALSIISFTWDNDLDKLRSIAAQVHVTNHSYGPSTGWDRRPGVAAGVNWIWWGDTTVSGSEDSGFGKYSSDNHVLDQILFDNPNVLTVVAAGNDRDDAPLSQPVLHLVRGIDPDTGDLAWFTSGAIRNRDGFDTGGLDTIAGLGLSKNCLCVGAINDLFTGGVPVPGAQIQPTFFSSWGPADDGRIKPDVVANGQTLLSTSLDASGTSSTPDEIYEELSGTSMASPTAAGISCVLAEFFQAKKMRRPTSAELKAVLIHTATDAGVAGPDPVFGFGSINALRAGEVINGSDGSIVRMDEVTAASPKTYTLQANGRPIRVTVVWADPPAPANTGGLDDPTRTLQNDLDVTLAGPDGAIFFPYQLDRTSPLSPAVKNAPNRVDNVEVIDAATASGAWIVRVEAAELGQGDRQTFALIVSGLKVGT